MRAISLPLSLLPVCASVACTTASKGSGTDDTGGGVDTGDTGAPGGAGTDHCGVLTASETWSADGSPHRVNCDVEVEGGTLTLEAGARVVVAENKKITISKDGNAASLVVSGTASDPVTIEAEESDDDVLWGGLAVYRYATSASISHLHLDGGGSRVGAGLLIQGLEVPVDGLRGRGAPTCGLKLGLGGTLAEGSAGIDLSGNAGFGACAESINVASLPAGGVYDGNDSVGVFLTPVDIDDVVTWKDLGTPYVVSDTQDVAGIATRPGVLTLAPGVEVQVENDQSIRVGRNNAAAGFYAEGTADDPITLTAYGSAVDGAWRGLFINGGAAQEGVRMAHVVLEAAGANADPGAALLIAGVTADVNHLTIESSVSAGFALGVGGRFSTTSGDIVVRNSTNFGTAPAGAVGSIPASLSSEDLATNLFLVTNDEQISEDGTWPDFGGIYWVEDAIRVNGTATETVDLTLAAGTELRFETAASLTIGNSGAARLVVAGTESDPVVMSAAQAETPGAWNGLAFRDYDSGSTVEWLDIGFGAQSFDANIVVDDPIAPVTLSNVHTHDSAGWGLRLETPEGAVLSDITYADNAAGDLLTP